MIKSGSNLWRRRSASQGQPVHVEPPFRIVASKDGKAYLEDLGQFDIWIALFWWCRLQSTLCFDREKQPRCQVAAKCRLKWRNCAG